ncbi:MAG: hypothetical protein DBX61_11390 [Clostridiales bacterium]|nr:MAG: hypothetical protein DBX61_11390 [Clostridiales bacterium]
MQKYYPKNSMLSMLAAVVLIMNSGYYLSAITDSYFPLILLIIFSAILTVWKSSGEKKIQLSSDNLLLILLLFGILSSTLINFTAGNLLSGGRVAATMLCSYLMLKRLDIKRVTKSYSYIIRFIIISAIILFILTRSGQLTSFPLINSEHGAYYNLLFVTQGLTASRICGAFWEPGVFASHIIIAFLFEIYFIDEKTKVIHIIIYMFGIFLTGSTAGILIIALVLAGYIIKRKNWDNRRDVKAIFFVIVIAGILTYDIIFERLAAINPTLFSKLVETTSATTYTRLNAPLVNLELFIQKPIFGWGFTGAAAQYSSYMNNRLVAQTSTSTQIMSAIGFLGIIYTLMCLLPVFSKRKLAHLSLIDKTIIFASLLLIVNKEPHIYFAITWLILFYINQNSQISGAGKDGSL